MNFYSREIYKEQLLLHEMYFIPQIYFVSIVCIVCLKIYIKKLYCAMPLSYFVPLFQ